MIKAIFISFFRSSNLGDLILSNEMYKLLSMKYEVTCIDFVTGDVCVPSDSADFITGLDKSSLKKIKPFSVLSKLVAKSKSLSRIYRYFTLTFKYNTLKSIEKCFPIQKVFIGGGNMIMDNYLIPDYSLRISKIVNYCYKKNIKASILQVGVGPLRSFLWRKRIKKITNKIDKFSVRDFDSYNIILKTTGFRASIVPDPAFMLQYVERNEKPRNQIGINIIDLGNYVNLELYSGLIQSILKISHYSIYMFCTEKSDFEFAKKINNLLNSKGIGKLETYNFSNKDTIIEKLQSTSVIISSRMHAAIISMTQNVPVILLSWQKKINSLQFVVHKELKIFQIEEVDRILGEIPSLIASKEQIDTIYTFDIDSRINEIRKSIMTYYFTKDGGV